MKQSVWLSVLVLGLLGDIGLGVDPGFVIRVSQEELDYATKAGVDLMQQVVGKGLPIPDQSGSYGVYVGSVDYTLNDVRACKLDSCDLEVSIDPGNGLRVTLKNARVFAEGRFGYTVYVMWIPSSNGGSFKVTLSEIAATVKVTAGMAPDGKPTITVTDCAASIGNIDLAIQADSGGWLIDLFIENIKSSCKQTIVGQFCDMIRKSVDEFVCDVIPKYTKICIEDTCSLVMDLSFVSPPRFNESFVETAHSGEITWKDDPRHAPFKSEPFKNLELVPPCKMISVFINPYVANTLDYALYENEKLSYRFTKKDLACENCTFLDTNCMDNPNCVTNIIPGISDEYPNSSVEFEFVATSCPWWSVSGNKSRVDFDVNVTIQIRREGPNDALVTIDVLLASGWADGPVYIENNRKRFAVADFRLVNVTRLPNDNGTSELSTGNSTDPSVLLEKIVELYIVPKINEIGSQLSQRRGFGGFELTDVTMQAYQNFYAVCAGFKVAGNEETYQH